MVVHTRPMRWLRASCLQVFLAFCEWNICSTNINSYNSNTLLITVTTTTRVKIFLNYWRPESCYRFTARFYVSRRLFYPAFWPLFLFAGPGFRPGQWDGFVPLAYRSSWRAYNSYIINAQTITTCVKQDLSRLSRSESCDRFSAIWRWEATAEYHPLQIVFLWWKLDSLILYTKCQPLRAVTDVRWI